MYAVDAAEPTRSAFRCVDNAVNTAIARTRYKHFYDGECRYRLLPTPPPRLREKRTSGSKVTRYYLVTKRVTSTNRCEVFLLNHKAALEPSDPVALTQTRRAHATRMVPGVHHEVTITRPRLARTPLSVSVCDCTAMDPHRFWADRGSL
jgi:hypothetical protein